MKAGGGYTVTVGEMCSMMVSKLDWFGTLFPRLPVSVQKDLEAKMKEYKMAVRSGNGATCDTPCNVINFVPQNG